MARRATGIKQLRSQNPNLLLLDAGNALTGQDVANQSHGLAIVEAMNLMGYDALALGAAELQLPLPELRAAIAQARFKVLSANVVTVDGKLLLEPYAVLEVGGRRVGLLGLTGTDARNPDLTVRDPLTTAQEYVPRLAQEADLVVVLSNAGLTTNQQIAARVPGIAVLVGGGGRTYLQQPEVINPTRTVMVQAGYEGRWLGVLQLRLDNRHVITDQQGQLWLLDRTVADDPDMVALVNRYKNRAGQPTATTVPPTPTSPPVPIPTKTPPTYPSPSPGT